jgi:hypothetical protein
MPSPPEGDPLLSRATALWKKLTRLLRLPLRALLAAPEKGPDRWSGVHEALLRAQERRRHRHPNPR